MRILALDAATEVCSAALLCDGELIHRSVESGRAHSQQLLDMVKELLAEAQVSLCALDGLAASIGPGAFTGVRITVAAAQGLAFGAGLRVVPVTTLEALALQVLSAATQLREVDHHDIVRAVACLDARMGEVYWATFRAEATLGLEACAEPRVEPPDRVSLPAGGHYRGIGRGFSAYPELLGLPGLDIDSARAQALPNALEMARLGALRLLHGGGLDPAELKPLYLRDKVALTEAERRPLKT